jgi:hypothetical protein
MVKIGNRENRRKRRSGKESEDVPYVRGRSERLRTALLHY